MAVGNRGQGVWRGEVFVWQRHRQWGGEAGEMRSRQGVWRGRGDEGEEVRECGTGEGQGGKEWAVWREGRAWEGRGVKRGEERWGGERGQ